MKVLWICLTPSLAEEYLNNKPMNGGFIKSLEKLMQDKVDLSVLFYYDKEISPFKYGKTNYFPILKANKSLGYKIKRKLFNHIEPENDLKKFIKIIEEVKPDLIHIHGTEGPFGLVQKFSDIPAVVSIQGNISVYSLKFFSGIPLLDILKYSRFKSRFSFTTYLNDFSRFKKMARREKDIFKISKNFIGRTNWDRRITKILSPGSNYFHNDEVLRDVFYDGFWQNNLDDSLNLFTTNAPNIYKGIETLIHCAHLLDLNNVRFTWRVAGLHAKSELIHIAENSIKIKASKNIEFLGSVSDSKLKEMILKSHIYVGVSHIENSPNSLCEALILGIPCIATNAGGTSNFIEDNKDGILIQDGDPYSMAGAIIEIKENYDIAIGYGIKARKKALLRHDKNTIANDLVKIYLGIVAVNDPGNKKDTSKLVNQLLV